jgi:hypothetical protein
MSRPVAASGRLWRLAGALALAHVALMLTGISFEPSVVLGDTRHDQVAGLLHGSLTAGLAGGCTEYLGFLVFLVDAALIAQLLRGSGDVQRWLRSCITAAGAVYTAITIAVGFAAGAAALYDGHHGADVMTAVTVNDVRNFGFFLSVGVLGVFTLAVAGAVQATRILPSWLAWTGYVVGVGSIAAVPAARIGGMEVANIAWLIWWIALAVLALRGPRVAARPATEQDFLRV